MNLNSIKTWLSNNKVCFVTNSTCLPSTLLVSSLKTYLEYIPIQNFWIIPGINNNEPFYGLNAFLHMIQYMLVTKRFDYVIYIDEDCFITDFENLINEFKNFVNSDCCLAGIQDGGVLCHRNHSHIMVNTFLSFWNIKMLRDSDITFNSLLSYIKENIEDEDKKENLYVNFKEALKLSNKELYDFMYSSAELRMNDIKHFRETHCSLDNHETPYCSTVRNDKNNKIEQCQEPYSTDDNSALSNFEPYYILEQILVLKTGKPIYYLFASDLYDDEYIKENKKFDLSGLTSAVYYGKSENEKSDHKLIAVHTWFSRAYTKWPTTMIQLEHTKRINSIIKEFSRI